MVNFPTSCNASAQKLISRGAALLHSFGYEEARLAFNDAASADRTCAMAHWGVARTCYHPIWAPPSQDELKQGAAALERAVAIGAKTERERDYINVLAVFYKDWQTVEHATRAKAYEQALAGEILNQVLPRHQNHPGVAHYIIHSVDYPSIAELGLKAARAYAKIAPDSPHALHMPSHIFTRLGLWDDSITSNTVSAKSAIAQAQRLRGGGGAFDQLHAIDYLVYAYLQQAKDKSAQKVLAEMAAIAKLDENQFAAAYAFAASPARWALERHDWKAAAALEVKPARLSTGEVAAIRSELPKTRDYDWTGSIGAQWEAATALVACHTRM